MGADGLYTFLSFCEENPKYIFCLLLEIVKILPENLFGELVPVFQ
jgi:hypothetical protein